MFKKIMSTAAMAFGLVAASAHATPIYLDFEGSADGALVQNFYNGGTDSLGNSGMNYGITFNAGATFRYDHDRTYISNVSSIAVANGFDLGAMFMYSTIQTARADSNYPTTMQDFLIYASGPTATPDSQYTPGTSYGPGCTKYPGIYCAFYSGFIRLAGDYTQLQFSDPTVALDSLTLGVAPDLSASPAVVVVPEPTTLALLGSGGFGLLARRRKAQKVN